MAGAELGKYAIENLVLDDVFRKQAEASRTRPFLKLPDGELTYGQVDDLVERMARGLAEIGVGQEHHVALMLPNGVDIVVVVLALARLGAVAVPINTAYKGELLRHVLSTSDTTVLVVDEPWVERVNEIREFLPALARLVVRTDEAQAEVLSKLTPPAVPLHRLLDYGTGAPPAKVRCGDLQAIMYTSGTTGPSKGVMVPHALALTCAIDSLWVWDGADKTVYCPLPLFHAAALWDGMMAALLSGSSIAIVERFSASRFWDDVRRFDANVAMGVFSMLPILLNQPPTAKDKEHPLTDFYVGKSALDEAFFQRFGVHSVETYTSTEIGIGTASPYGQWRPGSCGQAYDVRYDVALVDEWDREVGPGEPGEIVVRPRQPFVITTGYYGFPEATARTFRNLWFHTGDRATRDADGYYYFVDRIKEAIRRRGENISAFEVERVVNTHPTVLESAAFGVPSEVEEEDVKLAVVPRPGMRPDPEELRAFCEQKLPAFMVPKYIEVLDDLPRTPTGKIAKHELSSASSKKPLGTD
jgi:carnitine-CoA ligase